MALHKPYADIPGTIIFDAEMARIGYHLNQFCMSLMQEANRQRFRADERGYLDEWPMTEPQKAAVLARDYNRMIVSNATKDCSTIFLSKKTLFIPSPATL